MSTKEQFLVDIKEVIDRYHVYFPYKDVTGIPDGTPEFLDNRLNWAITGFKIEVPNEKGLYTYVSGKEFIQYMCNKKID